jgi:hypothetical protein
MKERGTEDAIAFTDEAAPKRKGATKLHELDANK